MDNFYIYIHIKLNDGKPFYVGKGKTNRAYWKGKTCTQSWVEKQIKSQSKKPLIVTDCNTNQTWEFINSKEAARFLNVSHSNIRTNKITGHKIKKRYTIEDKN